MLVFNDPDMRASISTSEAACNIFGDAVKELLFCDRFCVSCYLLKVCPLFRYLSITKVLYN